MTFRRDVQGLRAVAVLLVVLDHLGIDVFAGGFIGVDVFFVISGFLITSLLDRELTEWGTVTLSQFYLRRAKRILPAALLVILITVAASALLLSASRSAAVGGDAWWATFFAANVHLIREGQDYFRQTAAVSPLQHFWSLAVEEQFYLVWPALFLLVGRPRELRVAGWPTSRRLRLLGVAAVLVVASFAWSVVETRNHQTAAYFSTATRAWELGLGAMLGLALPAMRPLPRAVREAMSLGAIAVILGSACWVITERTPFPGAAALLPTVAAAAFLLAGAGDGDLPWGSRLVAVGPFAFVGNISFSLYLWHWPIVVFGEALFPDLDPWAFRGAALVAMSALALASYLLVEDRTRRWTIGSRPPREDLWGDDVRTAGFVLAGVTVLVAALAVVAPAREPDAQVSTGVVAAPLAGIERLPLPRSTGTSPPSSLGSAASGAGGPASVPSPRPVLSGWQSIVVTSAGVEDPSPLARERIDGASEPPAVQCDFGQNRQKRCGYGAEGAPRSVYLLGDSHAAMWRETLLRIFPSPEWNLVMWSAGNCGVALVDPAQVPDNRFDADEAKDCFDARRASVQDVVDNRPDYVFLSDAADRDHQSGGRPGFWTTPAGEVWSRGLAATLAALQPVADTTRVVLLSRTPGSRPLDSCLTRTTSLRNCSLLPSATRPIRQLQAEAVAAAPWATLVDVEPWFCTSSVCPAVIGDAPVYFDGDHLSTWIRPEMAPLLLEALTT